MLVSEGAIVVRESSRRISIPSSNSLDPKVGPNSDADPTQMRPSEQGNDVPEVVHLRARRTLPEGANGVVQRQLGNDITVISENTSSPIPEEFRNLGEREVREWVHPQTKKFLKVVRVENEDKRIAAIERKPGSSGTYIEVDWQTGEPSMKIIYESDGLFVRGALLGGGKGGNPFSRFFNKLKPKSSTPMGASSSQEASGGVNQGASTSQSERVDVHADAGGSAENSSLPQRDDRRVELFFQKAKENWDRIDKSHEIETEIRRTLDERYSADPDTGVADKIKEATQLKEVINRDQSAMREEEAAGRMEEATRLREKTYSIKLPFSINSHGDLISLGFTGKADVMLSRLQPIIDIGLRGKLSREAIEYTRQGMGALLGLAPSTPNTQQMGSFSTKEEYRPIYKVYDSTAGQYQEVRDDNTYSKEELAEWYKKDASQPIQERRDGTSHRYRRNAWIKELESPSGEKILYSSLLGTKDYKVKYLTQTQTNPVPREEEITVELPILVVDAKGINRCISKNPPIMEFGKPTVEYVDVPSRGRFEERLRFERYDTASGIWSKIYQDVEFELGIGRVSQYRRLTGEQEVSG